MEDYIEDSSSEELEEIEEIEEIYFQKPLLISRVKSMFIDHAIIFLLFFLAVQLFNVFTIESIKIKILVFFTIALYEPLLISIDRTLGQRIMKLKVVNKYIYTSSAEKKTLRLLSSFFRYYVKLSFGIISFFLFLFDDFGQTIHDKLSNSLVVRH